MHDLSKYTSCMIEGAYFLECIAAGYEMYPGGGFSAGGIDMGIQPL